MEIMNRPNEFYEDVAQIIEKARTEYGKGLLAGLPRFLNGGNNE